MLFRIAILVLALAGSRAHAQESVTLPYPWLEYCARTRDPGCIVQTITPFDLAIINREITEGIITREDDGYYDPWVPFPPDRMGDCDDRAASTRQALLALGVDPKALRFETGLVKEPDGRTLGHIVVVVTLDGREWVLDSKTPDKVYPPSKRPYAWKPMAAESPNILWSTP